MNQFVFFIAIATSIVLAVQVYKNVWAGIVAFVSSNFKMHKFPISLLLPIVLGYWGIFSYGGGLLSWLGMEYLTRAFKYFDLFTTGTVVAGGSGMLYEWLKPIFKARDFMESFNNEQRNASS